VVALPEDMLRDQRAAAVVGPYRAVRAHPGAADLAEMRRLLAAAERPIMLVGGSGWSDAAAADIARFAMANELPVCCSFRRQDIVDNRLPCFVGDLGTGAAPSLVGRIKEWLRERLPDDAIVTRDAGNFSGWPNRFLQYRRPGRQLGPTSGAMGYGVPAAVAAKLVHPGRIVVGFCGDGGFMMTGQELATALDEGVGPIILLFNNAMYGT